MDSDSKPCSSKRSAGHSMDIFTGMMKEEWRMHATMYGGRLFALFPLMLAGLAAVGTAFTSVLVQVIDPDTVAFIAHYSLLLFGVSVGAFGLLGREIMNRRFGQASLIAYSARSLPVSERHIMTAFYLKDVLYYMLLWVFPLLAGIAVIAPLLSYGSVVPRLLLSLPLAFLAGLAVVFLLSTIYVHSKPLLAASLLAGAAAGFIVAQHWALQPAMLLPPYLFFQRPTPMSLIMSGLVIVACSVISLLFIRVEYPSRERRYAATLPSLAGRLPVPHSWMVAKDLLDFTRSEGGVGKLVFGFGLPAVMVWLLFYVLAEFIPMLDFLPVFALFLGIIASSLYNWLTEFDTLAGYAFLPVSVATVIRGKVMTYLLLIAAPLAVLLGATMVSGQFGLLIPALCAFVGMSLYALSATVYLMGLHPTVLIYNAKLFGLYTVMTAPVAVLLLFTAALHPWLLCTALLLVPFAWYILRHGMERWERWESPDI